MIHGVQHVFHPPAWLDGWPDGVHSTRIVVIARGLDARWFEDLLDALDDEVAALDCGMTAMGAANHREEKREAKEERCSIW